MKLNNFLVYIAWIVIATGSGRGSAAVEPHIIKANFELAAEWTAQKQLSRTSDIWTTPLWLPGQNALFYPHNGSGILSYYYLNLDTGEKRNLTQHPGFSAIYERETRFIRESDTQQLRSVLRPGNPVLAENAEGITFNLGTHRYRYVISSNSFKEVGDPIPADNAQYLDLTSPNGKYRIDVNDQNLYLAFPGQLRTDRQITHDGQNDYSINFASISWSPDSRYVAFLREDWRQVADQWLVNHYSNPRPTLETFKWPIPGETIEQHELWVYEVSSKKLSRVKVKKWPDQTLSSPLWSPDSKMLYVHRMSRDWFKLDLCAISIKNRKVKVIIKERDHRQIYTRHPTHVIQSTGEIIWWSMRNGWGHYYLYNPDTKKLTTITSGDYHAGNLVHINDRTRTIFFMGNNAEPDSNPYLHHLYSITFSGHDLKRLTPENAEHEVTFSSTGDYFLDNYSRADIAPVTTIRKADGTMVYEPGPADISELTDAGWQPPEIFTVKAADNQTDMWGVMFKPYDFDPDRIYPVITYGYPGKEGEAIPFKFYNNSWFTLVSTSLAQYGFIVVVSGNRGGSPERSYAYYNFGEDNLRDYPIADRKAVLEHLIEKRPYMDIDRVGIMGSSSGGFMAATAILLEPDFFKVAVAKSGNHDNNLYYHHWNERYGQLEKPTRTNNQLVNNLKGRLLILHGDMDRYVPVSLASRLAYDLMMADKRFDMFIVPNGDHFWGDNWQYILKYTELYFVENLMGDRCFSVDIGTPCE